MRTKYSRFVRYSALLPLLTCYLIRILNIRQHPYRLASHHELAGAYQADGQIKKVVELLEHVVAVKSTVFRKDHPSRLELEQVLGHLYAALLTDPDLSHYIEVRP